MSTKLSTEAEKPALNKGAVMPSIFLLTVVLFYGYKKTAIVFWIMFPIIFLFTQMQDNREFFYSDYFMPIWMVGTPLFYLMYGLLLRWMDTSNRNSLGLGITFYTN
jgi:hypothetical protein